MIYVMSDIHGHMARFRDIMRQIRLRKEDHLYVLGDVIDRGRYGLPILMELLRMDNVTVMLGNHEHMMLEALETNDSERMYIWYMNGGDVTHRRLLHCTKAYRQEVMTAIKKMPVNLDICCNEINYLLVHGGPLEASSQTDAVYESVWKRLEYYAILPEGKTVIFGHTPTRRYQPGRPLSIFHGKNRIGIDCGCAYGSGMGGRLACLRLDDMKEFYSQANDGATQRKNRKR